MLHITTECQLPRKQYSALSFPSLCSPNRLQSPRHGIHWGADITHRDGLPSRTMRKPRKKRKNSDPKESPFPTPVAPHRHHSILHPPAQLSRSPPSPKSPSLSCHGGSNPLFILGSPIHLNFTSSTHPTLPATQPGQLHQRFHPARSHRFIIRCTFQLYRGRVRERHSLELSIDKILPG